MSGTCSDKMQEKHRQATEHLTLPLFPLATIADAGRDAPRRLDYERRIQTPDGPVIQRWTVRAGEGDTLPTADDMPFLMGLLTLWSEQHGGDESSDLGGEIEFTPRELFQLLGMGARSESYDRLKKALRRLASTYIEAEQAVYGLGGRWESAGWHLIDSWRLVDGRERGKTSRVRWGREFFETLRRGDIRPLDLKLYLDLKRPTTRELFRLLEHHRAMGQRVFHVDTDQLQSRLGMSPVDDPNEVRRRLRAAHQQLQETGVVSKVEYRAGRFTYTLADPIRAELHDHLVKLGFTARIASDLLLRHGPVTIIVYLDSLAYGQNRAEKTPAWLVAALRDGYDIRYHEDEPLTVGVMMELLEEQERADLWLRSRRICGIDDQDITCPLPHPDIWPREMRAVWRFLVDRLQKGMAIGVSA